MRRIVLSLFAVAALGGVAACGGDDSPPLSAEEFANQANAICRDAKTQLTQEQGNATIKTLDEETEFLLKKAIPGVRDQLDKIDDLKPPSKDKAKVDKMLETGRKAADVAEEGLEKQGTAFRQGGGTDEYKELQKQFNDLAGDLELTDCAEKS